MDSLIYAHLVLFQNGNVLFIFLFHLHTQGQNYIANIQISMHTLQQMSNAVSIAQHCNNSMQHAYVPSGGPHSDPQASTLLVLNWSATTVACWCACDSGGADENEALVPSKLHVKEQLPSTVSARAVQC